MFMGSTKGLAEFGSSPKDVLLPDNGVELEVDEDEEVESSRQILFMASFDELARSYIKYDTIIWLSISLLLVLAWGVGVIFLLYLPIFRYVLQKDLSSRKLYVTPAEIVYKITRPSYIPCWKIVVIERRVPLSLVIDVIIEQGCLQSFFGLHTFRVESISRGKTTAVDVLQVQGVSNPGLLRKVIITEAAKVIQDSGVVMNSMSSLTKRLAPAKYRKGGSSAYPVSTERRSAASDELLLHKIDEVSKSVKRIESLIDKSRNPTRSS